MNKSVENQWEGDLYVSPAVSSFEISSAFEFCVLPSSSVKPVKPGEIEPGEWGEDL